MKKICSIFLSLVLCLSISATVFAEGSLIDPYADEALLKTESVWDITFKLGEGVVINYGSEKIADSKISSDDTDFNSEHMSIHSAAASWNSLAENPVEVIIDLKEARLFSGVRVYSRVWRPWAASGNNNLHPSQAMEEGYISVSEDGVNYYDFDIMTFDAKNRYSDILCRKYGYGANIKVRYVKVVPKKLKSDSHWTPEEICLLKPNEAWDNIDKAGEIGPYMNSKVNSLTEEYLVDILGEQGAKEYVAEINALKDPVGNKNAVYEILERAEKASGLETVNLKYTKSYEAGNAKILSFYAKGEDEAIVEAENGKIRAVGLGSAVIENMGKKTIVKVSPTPIALVIVSGQSNAAGDGSDHTLAPRATGDYKGRFLITNTMDTNLYSFGGKVTLKDAVFAAEHGGLSSQVPANTTTKWGSRSSGSASALGKRLSDKWDMPVWVLNTGVCGRIMNSFNPYDTTGEKPWVYERTISYANDVKKIIAEDPHYYLDETKTGLFWLQGCSDGLGMSSEDTMEEYRDAFMNMYNGWKENIGINYAGIWLVRATASNNGANDFYMSGPRLAQIYLGNSAKEEHKNIYLIMNTDILGYDKSLAEYLDNKYPDWEKFSNEYGYELPETTREVKPDIHYSQKGYNEIGDEAAENIYKIQEGNTEITSAIFLNYYGKETEKIILKAGEADVKNVLVPMQTNITYNPSGALTIRILNDDIARYDNETFILKGKKCGRTVAELLAGDKVLALCLIEVTEEGKTPEGFYDMPKESHPSYNALKFAVEKGILTGFSDGFLRGEEKLTRGQMAAILSRANNLTEVADISKFTDVREDNWYYKDMQKAYKAGYFKGDGSFLKPDAYITREETFVVLARAYNLGEGNENSLASLSDAEKISFWARGAASAMTEKGHIEAGGALRPLEDITRAEFAEIIYSILTK